MRNTILKAALAAIVLASPLAATEASAKIKEVKFHFVKDAYADYPVYEMKYQNGKWVWANKGKAFKPRMKFRIKHNKGGVSSHHVTARFYLEKVEIGTLSGIKNVTEDLVVLNIGSNIMKHKEKAARAACNAHGGTKKVIRDMGLNGQLTVRHSNYGKHKQTVNRSAVMTAKVVCQPRGPKRTGALDRCTEAQGREALHCPSTTEVRQAGEDGGRVPDQPSG